MLICSAHHLGFRVRHRLHMIKSPNGNPKVIFDISLAYQMLRTHHFRSLSGNLVFTTSLTWMMAALAPSQVFLLPVSKYRKPCAVSTP